MDAAGHRELAVSTFNRVWELLELPERTPKETDEMIHAAHVSCYVWSQIGTPANVARGEWQCARVYATLGRAEPALWHAGRALELNEAGGEGFEEWDLPSAQQGMAHAQRTLMPSLSAAAVNVHPRRRSALRAAASRSN